MHGFERKLEYLLASRPEFELSWRGEVVVDRGTRGCSHNEQYQTWSAQGSSTLRLPKLLVRRTWHTRYPRRPGSGCEKGRRERARTMVKREREDKKAYCITSSSHILLGILSEVSENVGECASVSGVSLFDRYLQLDHSLDMFETSRYLQRYSFGIWKAIHDLIISNSAGLFLRKHPLSNVLRESRSLNTAVGHQVGGSNPHSPSSLGTR